MTNNELTAAFLSLPCTAQDAIIDTLGLKHEGDDALSRENFLLAVFRRATVTGAIESLKDETTKMRTLLDRGAVSRTLSPQEEPAQPAGEADVDRATGRAVIEYLFEYHAPNPEQVTSLKLVRAAAKALALTIHENCPASADRTAAMRKLQEAVNTANRAITLNGRSYK